MAKSVRLLGLTLSFKLKDTLQMACERNSYAPCMPLNPRLRKFLWKSLERIRFCSLFRCCGATRKSRATRCQNSSLVRRLATSKAGVKVGVKVGSRAVKAVRARRNKKVYLEAGKVRKKSFWRPQFFFWNFSCFQINFSFFSSGRGGQGRSQGVRFDWFDIP